MQTNDCNLKDCFLCNHSTPEWKEMIGLKRIIKRYKKGNKIFAEGEPVKGIYFVNSGLVKVHMQWPNQNELIIRFARSGEILGHRAMVSDGIYPVSATALAETRLCFIPIDFWQNILQANHKLTFSLMELYAKELHATEIRMRSLVQMETRGRISKALLDMDEQFGKDEENQLNFSISRQDIASYAGTTYETLFRFFRELIEKNIISTVGKKMKLIDVAKLREFVQ